MRRYNPVLIPEKYHYYDDIESAKADMKEEKDGLYVKFEDHLQTVKQYHKLKEKYENLLKNK